VTELLRKLQPKGISERVWMARGLKLLKTASVMDITEYGRAAHAEMEALLSCARSGITTRRSTLFSTTFPCHNCAKHIIASGVRRVVYVEPYPKSQAIELFGDSISLGPSGKGRRVRFESFVGIGPRRFIDLFSMSLSSGTTVKRKQSGGKKLEWSEARGIVRIPLMPNSYLERERLAQTELLNLTREPEDS